MRSRPMSGVTGQRAANTATQMARKCVHASATKKTEMCVIVDEHNNVVGAQPRDITVRERLLGRGSYVLMFNSDGQLFVSQRSASKDCYPSHLDVVISGVVNAGEEYADTARRELEEEVGMPPEACQGNLQQLFVFPYKDETCHVWGAAFRVVYDGGVRLQEEEVEWGRWVDLRQVQEMLGSQQFTPVGKHVLQLYLERQWGLQPEAQ